MKGATELVFVKSKSSSASVEGRARQCKERLGSSL